MQAKTIGFFTIGLFCICARAALAKNPDAGSPGELPKDARLGGLVDLYKNYFPFEPPRSMADWKKRAERVRRQTLVSNGLWPMPNRTSPRAVVHGKVDREDYTVEKVILESYPGHFVTGNLYRPKGRDGKLPGVLSPHGHFANGRFYDCGPKKIDVELVEGRERFEIGGRYPHQSRCVQLARMGCVVFHYDMVGYADSVQLPHRPSLRKEMNTMTDWGYSSPQAELRLQNVMGLQTYNSIRALDWLTSLPEVDTSRIGVTGASGGGTQTFILSALDPRVTVSIPAVMVSTAMQGGCNCENAPYLRCDSGNVEIAALTAPRFQGLIAADDWTHEIETKGLPELRALYQMLGARNKIQCRSLLQFPHNYNYVSRGAMYQWFNEQFRLGLKTPVVEQDYQPLSIAEMTVWNDNHPKPSGGPDYERSLLRQITQESEQQIEQLIPSDKETLTEYRRVVGGAWDILVGRSVPARGAVTLVNREENVPVEFDYGTWTVSSRRMQFKSRGEEVPVVLLSPKTPQVDRVVIWLHPLGKRGLFTSDDKVRPEIKRLVESGVAVLGIDLFGQGEFTPDGRPLEKQPVHPGNQHAWSHYAGYTYGYNSPLFSKRVHDVLSAIALVRELKGASVKIDLVGLGGAGHWAAAARAQAGSLVDRAIVDAAGFRFAEVNTLDHPDFLPGAAKYLDLPGLLSLSAPHKLWVANVPEDTRLIRAVYQAAGAVDQLEIVGEEGRVRGAKPQVSKPKGAEPITGEVAAKLLLSGRGDSD